MTSRGTRCSSGTSASRTLEPLGAGRVEQVAAVDVEHVEEVRRDRDAAARDRPGPCATRSPGTAAAGRRRRARSPRRRARARRAGRDRDDLDHLGQPVGDVVEAAGGDRDLVAAAVHLDPDAVELGVDRHRVPAAAGLRHRRRARRARWRPASAAPAGHLEPDLGQRLLAAGHRGDHDRHGAAREHRGAAYDGQRARPTRPRSPPGPARRGRPGGRCRSPRRAASAARRRSPGRTGRATPAARASCEPGAGQRGEPVEGLVHLERGQRRLVGRARAASSGRASRRRCGAGGSCRRGTP